FGRQRRRALRRCPVAGPDVSGPSALVFLRRQALQLRGIAARDGLLIDLLEEGNAPAATGAGAAALRHLAGHPGLAQPGVVRQLAARDVKAVTHLGVEVHAAAQEKTGSLHHSRARAREGGEKDNAFSPAPARALARFQTGKGTGRGTGRSELPTT